MMKSNGEVADWGRNPPESEPPVERRAMRRQRAFKGGVLKFNHDFCVFECVVRNLSERGAKLAFGCDTLSVPRHFDLRIGLDGEWRAAMVCWRGATDLGVVFAEA